MKTVTVQVKEKAVQLSFRVTAVVVRLPVVMFFSKKKKKATGREAEIDDNCSLSSGQVLQGCSCT